MPRHILCIGAHPDDVEVSMGGTAALFAQRGDRVKFVSVTDGSKGHYTPEYIQDPDSLASRRYEEALASVSVIGAEYETLGIPDGEVYVAPASTEEMVRLIRNFGEPGKGPDLVILNRPNDYHRDHRYTARLVLDATYMLTVPPMCPDTRHLDRMPVFAYWADSFTEEGGPFRADVAIAIDSVFEKKIDMVCSHASQFFEWLPFNASKLDVFPTEFAARREYVAGYYRAKAESIRQNYGHDMNADTKFAEAFQISEYGRKPDSAEISELFPRADS